MQKFFKTLETLMVAAWMLPEKENSTYTMVGKTVTKYYNYTNLDYVKEAVRITKYFLLNKDTMMNPNIRNGQINATAYYLANSTADYILDDVRGDGVGMITFDDVIQMLIDGLLLLEQFPTLQTSLTTDLKTDIATTIAGSKSWLT